MSSIPPVAKIGSSSNLGLAPTVPDQEHGCLKRRRWFLSPATTPSDVGVSLGLTRAYSGLVPFDPHSSFFLGFGVYSLILQRRKKMFFFLGPSVALHGISSARPVDTSPHGFGIPMLCDATDRPLWVFLPPAPYGPAPCSLLLLISAYVKPSPQGLSSNFRSPIFIAWFFCIIGF